MTSLKIDNNINIIYYDVFSFGLDGQIGSYRIEFEENKNEKIDEIQKEDFYIDNNNINTHRNNLILENNNNNINIKKFKMKKSILIEDDNNNEIENIHFIYLNKVFNFPIIDFFFIDEDKGLLLGRNNFSYTYMNIILFRKMLMNIVKKISTTKKIVFKTLKN